MKNIIKLSFMFLLCIATKIQAQTPIIFNTNFTIGGVTFNPHRVTDTLSYGTIIGANSLHVGVLGGSTSLPVPGPVTRDCELSVAYYGLQYKKQDFITFYNVLRSVFSPARMAAIVAHDGEGLEGIYFRIYPNGVIDDIGFSLLRNSIVTQEEIYQLYTRLKTQLVFTTSPVGCPNIPVGGVDVDIRRPLLIHTDPYYFGNGPSWD